MRWVSYLILGVASLPLGCAAPGDARPRKATPSSLVLIHTADLHSHLFPEQQQISGADAARGLGPAGEVAEVGGFARIGGVIADIRAAANHHVYLDSGDLVEGTAAFTEFGGEPELRALSALGLDAAALGNHDLSLGAEAFAGSHREFASFPVLASNFGQNGSELASVLSASVVLDAQGVKVGVIGVANPSSPSGLAREDNPYGIELITTAAAVQVEIDRLRSEVDVLIALSHLGLDGDQRLIRDTTGLDVVLGGHQHLALDAAQERTDCGPELEADRSCSPRSVFLAHSGALGRYVGELDLELAAEDEFGTAAQGRRGLRVVSAEHSLIPISAEVEEDRALAALLEPYRQRLNAAGFDTPVAFALSTVERYGPDGGDSALGDLITDAMRARSGADFALINTTGMRANLPAGDLTRTEFGAALPFTDALTVLTLSGAQLRALFNQQARVASGRKCQTPIQISGLSLAFKCSGTGSSALALRAGSRLELDPRTPYTLVTSVYLAEGGSGFDALTEAVAREDLELDSLNVLLDFVASSRSCARSPLPCLDPSALRDGRVSAHVE